MTLEEKLTIEKQRYYEFIEKNKTKKIYIYGAGKQATAVAEFLLSNSIVLEGFCVTDKKNNRSMENGLPVYQIDAIKLQDEDAAFIIGVRNQLNNEIIEILHDFGYHNILEATDLIRYLGTYGYSFYTNPMMEITTKIGCAVNCKYCPQNVFIKEYLRKSRINSLSLDNYKKCLNKLPQNTLIEFAGFTEPFFNDDCLEMIKYTVEQGHKVNIFTTLLGLDDSKFEQLKKIHFEEFVVHVPDEEGYSTIPINDDYKKRLSELVHTTKMNGKPFIDYACSQGTVPNQIKEILGNHIRTYIVLNDRAGNLENNDNQLYCRKNINGKIRCELASDINHNVLLPDGRVVLCSNDWGMKHVMGNLLEQDYESIIHGEEAKKIRHAMETEGVEVLCRNCFQAIQVN